MDSLMREISEKAIVAGFRAGYEEALKDIEEMERKESEGEKING